MLQETKKKLYLSVCPDRPFMGLMLFIYLSERDLYDPFQLPLELPTTYAFRLNRATVGISVQRVSEQ
jgi:hypothetical protein